MVINYGISEDSIKRINDFFTQGYDFKQWFIKLKTYEILLERTEDFFKSFADEELKKEGIEPYKLKIKAEIYFTFFHMAESLFSLMYCALKTEIPWLSMKSLRFKDLCDYVKDEIVAGKISDENIRFLFFNGIVGDDAKQEIIVSSISFIKEFLKKLGKIFLDNEIYSEFKHGLRVMTTNSYINVTPENIKNAKPVLSLSGIAHVYLTTDILKKVGKEEFHRVNQKTLAFDYELYLRLCRYIYRLIDNLFNTRKQRESLKIGDKMSVQIFSKDDIKEVFKEDYTKKFSFTIHYP